jgi:hypothetical protein
MKAIGEREKMAAMMSERQIAILKGADAHTKLSSERGGGWQMGSGGRGRPNAEKEEEEFEKRGL